LAQNEAAKEAPYIPSVPVPLKALTIRILPKTLRNFTICLKVNMPALCLSSLILQGESEDGIALLDRIFSFGIG
jgi:hypothetical protein